MTDRYKKYKPIPDFEKYHCSNFGRVKSFARYPEGKILTPHINKQGYLCVDLWKDGKGKKFLVSRLVAITFLPNPLNKPQVDHIDTHRFNNHVSNLRWATGSENTKYTFENGRQAPQGEEHPNSKLTAEQVELIRLNPDGLSQKELGEIFNISSSTIGLIQRGKKWKSVGGRIRKEKPPAPLKIPAENRALIREMYRTGQYSQRQLAEMFHCCHATIINILKEKQNEPSAPDTA